MSANVAISSIDDAIAQWRQGDAVLDGAPPFVFLADMRSPVTEQAKELAKTSRDEIDVVDIPSYGLIVVSQTCDLVRSCAGRPFAEVAALVKLDAQSLAEVARRRRPQYITNDVLQSHGLAADLDRIMTVEKALLVGLASRKVRTVESDKDARGFAAAVGRKRTRVAFPDSFTEAFEPVRQRIVKNTGKQTAEGEFLAAVQELRVRARPRWDASVICLDFVFLFSTHNEIPKEAQVRINTLLKNFKKSDEYPEPAGYPASFETLPAIDYLERDLIDLSERNPPSPKST